MPSWRWPKWCHGADRAYRRRQGLLEEETEGWGDGQQGPAESPRWLSDLCHPAGLDSPDSEPDTPGVGSSPCHQPLTARPPVRSPRLVPRTPQTLSRTPRTCRSSAQRAADSPAAGPVTAAGAPDPPDGWPDTSNVRIIPVRTESDSTDTEPTVLQSSSKTICTARSRSSAGCGFPRYQEPRPSQRSQPPRNQGQSNPAGHAVTGPRSSAGGPIRSSSALPIGAAWPVGLLVPWNGIGRRMSRPLQDPHRPPEGLAPVGGSGQAGRSRTSRRDTHARRQFMDRGGFAPGRAQPDRTISGSGRTPPYEVR